MRTTDCTVDVRAVPPRFRRRWRGDPPDSRAFTIIELLVVVSIIALLVSVLLPAITKATDQARLTVSVANLRGLSAAHYSYSADWADKQFTLIAESISSYGDNPNQAFEAYNLSLGRDINGNWVNHPGIRLGWGYDLNGTYGNW